MPVTHELLPLASVWLRNYNERDGRRTVSVLSAIYGGLPDDVRVWHLEKDFVPFDRSRGEAAFQSLREATV